MSIHIHIYIHISILPGLDMYHVQYSDVACNVLRRLVKRGLFGFGNVFGWTNTIGKYSFRKFSVKMRFAERPTGGRVHTLFTA